ncbi:MAG: hypothetical protein ACOH2F_19430 [Cellulomonas sp.]
MPRFSLAEGWGIGVAVGLIESVDGLPAEDAPSGTAVDGAAHTSVAVQDLYASQLTTRDSDLAAERDTTASKQIVSEAGAAIDAQSADFPESALQLLR